MHSDWMRYGQDFTEWGKGSLNLEKTSGGGGGGGGGLEMFSGMTPWY